MAAGRLQRPPNDRRARVDAGLPGVEAEPDQSAAPIEIKFRGRKRLPDGMGDRRRLARRRAEPPDYAACAFDERVNRAGFRPERLRFRLVEARAAADERFERV